MVTIVALSKQPLELRKVLLVLLENDSKISHYISFSQTAFFHFPVNHGVKCARADHTFDRCLQNRLSFLAPMHITTRMVQDKRITREGLNSKGWTGTNLYCRQLVLSSRTATWLDHVTVLS